MDSTNYQEYDVAIPVVFGAKKDVASLMKYRKLEEEFVFSDERGLAILYMKTMIAAQLFDNNLCRIFSVFSIKMKGYSYRAACGHVKDLFSRSFCSVEECNLLLNLLYQEETLKQVFFLIDHSGSKAHKQAEVFLYSTYIGLTDGLVRLNELDDAFRRKLKKK